VTGSKASPLPRYALLLALICAFAILKGLFDPGLGARSLDGDYYYQIARHLSEGDGLKSSVSLYHQGFKSFPHRVNQNPLWLLMLGYSGRWFGLEKSALLLPEILYLLNLALLYLLANRLWRGIGRPGQGLLFREGRIPDFGHVAVVILGANTVFFRFTSLPYTDALGFLFLFGALLLLDRAARGRSLAWAGGAGLLAGLALLTRAQMVVLVLALPAALVLAGLRERRFFGLAALALGASLLSLVPWWIYLWSWMDSLTPSTLIGLAEFRETPELASFPHTIQTSSLWHYLCDRAGGVLVAFDPRHPHSYLQPFGWAVYLVPLGLLYYLAGRVGQPLAIRRGVEAERVLVLAMLLCGAGMLGPVHLAHGSFFKEWLFAHRHGLPFFLLLLPALGYLDGARASWVRWLSAGLLVTTLVGCGLGIGQLMQTRFPSGISEVERQLVTWLDRQSPRPAVVTTRAQKLAVFSRSAFHWMECSESFDQTLALLRHARADYVLMFGDERSCGFLQRRAAELRTVASFSHLRSSVVVLALRDPAGEAR
jgi:4-amino-4-deoxy-L-arabinose transferase-like glycosyltransferase